MVPDVKKRSQQFTSHIFSQKMTADASPNQGSLSKKGRHEIVGKRSFNNFVSGNRERGSQEAALQQV
jgi:hypothetical protein